MRVQVHISFSKTSNMTIAAIDAGPPGSDVSNYYDIYDGASKGFKGMHVCEASTEVATDLSGQYNLYPDNGYPGFISNQIASSEGVVDISCSFKVTGPQVHKLFVAFDEAGNEYATQFSISNNKNSRQLIITGNTQPVCTLILDNWFTDAELSGGVIFTLQINGWSKPYALPKISRIALNVVKIYTGKDLIDLKCAENFLDAQMQISPGICEQYADIKIYDRDRSLRTLAYKGDLDIEYPVTIEAIDSSDRVYTLGIYSIASWQIEGTSDVVGITCRDNTYIFKDIDIPKVAIQDRTLDDFINLLFSYAAGQTWKYIDNETRDYCKNIKIPDSWYLASDLYTMLTKICSVGMLRIYWYIDTFIIGGLLNVEVDT